MRLSIIPDDKMVVLNGIGFCVEFEYDPAIHAVQWDESSGHIEYKNGTIKQIDSVNEFQSIIDLYEQVKEKNNKIIQDIELNHSNMEKSMNDRLPYVKERVKKYGTVKDQLDMMYWDSKNGTKHWEQFIDDIKSQHPKE